MMFRSKEMPDQGSSNINFSSSDMHTPGDLQFRDTSPFNWHLTMRAHAWRPPTDVFETDEAIVVRVEIAGMREGDFAIELNGRYLSIYGVRPDINERRAFHQMEIRYGEFSLDLELPTPVEADHVDAVYSNGFLRVILPKAHPRQIRIIE
jgi:HSP20 family protein